MDITDPKDLGETLRKTRKAQKLTQAELASQSGVGLRFLRELEGGKPTCQIGKALPVLTMLGLKLTLAPKHDVFD